jgi:hypothetical protein
MSAKVSIGRSDASGRALLRRGGRGPAGLGSSHAEMVSHPRAVVTLDAPDRAARRFPPVTPTRGNFALRGVTIRGVADSKIAEILADRA